MAELTLAQARKLMDALGERSTGDETQTLIDGAFQTDLHCPHCRGRHIHRHGMARGLLTAGTMKVTRRTPSAKAAVKTTTK